jgi:putative ABC transport system ATP-binding protein
MSEAGKPAARLRGIGKTFREGSGASVVVLQDVFLDLFPGELVTLCGPSGSGKTTLLSIMGCLLKPTVGKLEMLGRDVTMVPESEMPYIRRRCVGFVFQAFHLFPSLTAFENVRLAFDVKGRPAKESGPQSIQLLEELGLSAELHRKPDQLSGGQKQRVAIARAVAGNPQLILADEPTAALDAESSKVVMELLQRMARRDGRTVIVVTHDPRVNSYADRRLFIAEGRLKDGEAH